MKKFIREPLVQFVLLGAILAVLISLGPDSGTPRDDQIVVTAQKIDHLAGLWIQTWKRPPTPEELDGLVRDYLREELAYREGTAVGMDRDDAIIRRRIRQKMEFIAEDIGAMVEPTDDDLQEYLDANPDDFLIGPVFTFRQVFFSGDQRGSTVESDARDVLAQLSDSRDLDSTPLGDRVFFKPGYADEPIRDVASEFGMDFAMALEEVEPGHWQGPIRSAYGLHLVFIDEKIDGGVPPLSVIRPAVIREWKHTRKGEMLELFYEELAQKYEITVEWDKILEGAETP